jgi:CMP-N-acetylneuraminic acid synthetase
MKPLCVIPARRGSKRLPLKNLLPLNGKPMLAYSVEVAIACRLFEKVYVSTEDEEIAEVAKQHGADVHIRPKELAGDMVSGTDVCLDVYRSRHSSGDQFDAIVCLQPTSPLRQAEDICQAWERFCRSGASCLVSVTPIDPHYFHWAVHQTGEWWEMVFGDQYMMERQSLPAMFRPNGSIKIGRVDALIQRPNFFGKRLVVYETPEERSIHVATKFDFEVAAHVLRNRVAARMI